MKVDLPKIFDKDNDEVEISIVEFDQKIDPNGFFMSLDKKKKELVFKNLNQYNVGYHEFTLKASDGQREVTLKFEVEVVEKKS